MVIEWSTDAYAPALRRTAYLLCSDWHLAQDLTQTALGISRDDAGRFLPRYVELGVYAADPFVRIDRDGVGGLMRLGIEGGRRAKPDLKIGICGEHGGEPSSVEFCHGLGLSYVSCSPFRVPIARLAAAQAALRAPVASP